MAWQDMKLYWAWRGACPDRAKGEVPPPPPTIKKLDYVTINKNTPCEQSLCIGVWDDDKYTPLHRTELEFHLKQYHWEDEVPFPTNGTLVT